MFKKTVDSVLEVFNKTIADLEAVQVREYESSVSKAKEAKVLMDASYQHEQEAIRADKVVNKLKQLIGGI